LCQRVAGGYWIEAFNEVERYLDAVDRGYRQQPPGINLRRVKDLLYQVVCQKRTEELVPMYLELGMVNEAMRARDTYIKDASQSRYAAYHTLLAALEAGRIGDWKRALRLCDEAAEKSDCAVGLAAARRAVLLRTCLEPSDGKIKEDVQSQLALTRFFWPGGDLLYDVSCLSGAVDILERLLARELPAETRHTVIGRRFELANDQDKIRWWSEYAAREFRPKDPKTAAEWLFALSGQLPVGGPREACLRLIIDEYPGTAAAAGASMTLATALLPPKEPAAPRLTQALFAYASMIVKGVSNNVDEAVRLVLASPQGGERTTALEGMTQCLEELQRYTLAAACARATWAWGDQPPVDDQWGDTWGDKVNVELDRQRSPPPPPPSRDTVKSELDWQRPGPSVTQWWHARHRLLGLERLAAVESDGPQKLYSVAEAAYLETGVPCVSAMALDPIRATAAVCTRLSGLDPPTLPGEDDLAILRRTGLHVDSLPLLSKCWRALPDLQRSGLFGYLVCLPGGDEVVPRLVIQEFRAGTLVSKTSEDAFRYAFYRLLQLGDTARQEIVTLFCDSDPQIRAAIRSIFRGYLETANLQPVQVALIRLLPKIDDAEQQAVMPFINYVPPTSGAAEAIAEALLKQENKLAVADELRGLLDGMAGRVQAEAVPWDRLLRLTPLMLAVDRNDLVRVRKLTADGAGEIDSRDWRGQTALFRAVRSLCYDDTAIIAALLKAGADPNITLEHGRTPLADAVDGGKLEAVRVLLDAGANLNIPTPGLTPLVQRAIARGFDRIAREFIRPGLALEANLNNLQTVLMWAARSGYAVETKRLLAMGAQINARDGEGKTALIWAVFQNPGGCEIPRLLLAAGSDPQIRDEAGKTALDYAVGDDLRTLLRTAGGPVRQQP
jgi:ankyrin repeat protein